MYVANQFNTCWVVFIVGHVFKVDIVSETVLKFMPTLVQRRRDRLDRNKTYFGTTIEDYPALILSFLVYVAYEVTTAYCTWMNYIKRRRTHKSDNSVKSRHLIFYHGIID